MAHNIANWWAVLFDACLEEWAKSTWLQRPFLVFTLLVGLVGVPFTIIQVVLYEVHGWQRESKLANLRTALEPTIEALRPNLVPYPPTATRARLSRPYVFVDLVAANSGRRWADLMEDNEENDVGDIKTLILIKDEEIEQQSYQRNTGHVSTYHRYRYRVWAFDMKSGSLGAYISLEDPAFLPHYYNSRPDRLAYSELHKWGDAVTDTSSTSNGQ